MAKAPASIMAKAPAPRGIEANLFFTFFGLDVIHKARDEHINVANVGNPGLHFPRCSAAFLASRQS